MNQDTSTGLMSYRDSHFELNFIGNFFFEIKRPVDCSIIQLHYFYLKLRKGNKVSPVNLHEKIYSAEYLGFCYHQGNLVGISAIKKPTTQYIESVHEKAGIMYGKNGTFLEIGYSFTEEDFRQKGISTKLKMMLLNKISNYKCTLFSTTATASSQRFLKAQGFVPHGTAYRGTFDDDIIYFEKHSPM